MVLTSTGPLAETKNRDIVITIGHSDDVGIDEKEVEEGFMRAFSEARSVKFVHPYLNAFF